MAFKWEGFFETGIELVDRQHRGLVDLVNQAAPMLGGGQPLDPAVFEALMAKLLAYAATHFADEEALMQRHGLEPAHQSQHLAAHARFVSTLKELRAEVAEGGALAGPALLRFLAGWLTFHILDEDQRMARQIRRIEQGASAAEAWRSSATVEQDDQARAALVAALGDLYAVLGERNKALRMVNERLKKTQRELEEANRGLEFKVGEAVAQVERTQGQLLQSEKLAAIGQLAAGVAHEINNPVGFVNSNLGSLKKYVAQLFELLEAHEQLAAAAPAGDARLKRVREVGQRIDLAYLREDVPELLEESTQGLGRVTRIVQDLKDFSHVDNQAEWQQADLVAGLESTLNVVANEIKYKAEVRREFTEIPKVRCVPSQINQVFMNLLVNAAQAIEGRGVITLATGCDPEGAWVEVGDTGKGMDAATLKRIFEPFYTTKPVGKGTGLGLSLSWDIVVEKHKGRLEASSTPGEGSRFRIWLPLAGAEAK